MDEHMQQITDAVAAMEKTLTLEQLEIAAELVQRLAKFKRANHDTLSAYKDKLPMSIVKRQNRSRLSDIMSED